MKLRPVQALIVHRGQQRVRVLSLALAVLAVDTRSGRHVQAPVPADVGIVMDPDERRLVLAGQRDAGGPVRLVANDQIEPGQPFPLRRRDRGDGLIGGEHNGQPRGRLHASHLREQPVRVGGGGKRQVVDGHVVVIAHGVLLADLRIRADGEGTQRLLGLIRPLAQGLGEQGDGGDQEQHSGALAMPCLGALGLQPFSDLQSGERLTRSTGHDQLAATVLGKALEDIVDRLTLMLARRLARSVGSTCSMVWAKRHSTGLLAMSARPIRVTGIC